MYVGQKTKIHIKNHIPCLTPIFPHIISTTIGQKTESMQNGQNKEFFVTKPYSYPLFQAIILLAALFVPINHAPENKRKQYCHLLKLVIQRLLVPSHPCPSPSFISSRPLPLTTDHFPSLILAVLNLTLALMQLSNAKWKGSTSNWDNWVSHWMGALATLPLPRRWNESRNRIGWCQWGTWQHRAREQSSPNQVCWPHQTMPSFAQYGVYLDDDGEVLFWCTRPLFLRRQPLAWWCGLTSMLMVLAPHTTLIVFLGACA